MVRNSYGDFMHDFSIVNLLGNNYVFPVGGPLAPFSFPNNDVFLLDLVRRCCLPTQKLRIFTSLSLWHQVFLWNMDTKQTESTPEGHTLIITDVRFRPNSTHLATSSLDRTVRLWNAAEVMIAAFSKFFCIALLSICQIFLFYCMLFYIVCSEELSY